MEFAFLLSGDKVSHQTKVTDLPGEGRSTMYEIVATYRTDFSEKVVGRYSKEEEAQDKARHLAAEHYDKILRVWVRVVREAPSKG